MGTVISRRYTLQSLVIIKNKIWLVKKDIAFDAIKVGKIKNNKTKQKHCAAITVNKTPKRRSTTVLSQLVK